MQSKGYSNCNGVVIFNKNVIGLYHYDFGTKLSEMLDQILCFDDIENLSAVIIGGDRNHFERNKFFLKEHKIPIIGKYCDAWMALSFFHVQ